MKGARLHYSDEELAWIEERKHLPRAVLHAAFVYVFLREDVSQANLTALCKRKGWRTGRSGRFEPGQESWSKGKKLPTRGRSAETQFKKGERKGRSNHVYKPIGTERVSKSGYIERKIHDGMPMHSRWRAVHLIRWEEVNGPVPDKHALKCLDGDRANTDPTNWIAVPRAIFPRLAGRWARKYDDAPEEIKPTLLAIARLEYAAREARKAKRERAP